MSDLRPLPLISQERNERIDGRHLRQLAVVYIRQSSMQPVHRDQEAPKIQYGLVSMAQRLGWATDRVLTIDDDRDLRQLCGRPSRVPAPTGRGRPRPCGHHPGRRDVAPGPVEQGLAPTS